MLSHLPIDAMRQIVSHVDDDRDLSRLACVSRTLRHAADEAVPPARRAHARYGGKLGALAKRFEPSIKAALTFLSDEEAMRRHYPTSHDGRHVFARDWRTILAFWRASRRAFAKRQLRASMISWYESQTGRRYTYLVRRIMRDVYAFCLRPGRWDHDDSRYSYSKTALERVSAIFRGEVWETAEFIESLLMDMVIATIDKEILKFANGRFALNSMLPELMKK
jgi:hypothetical protein